MKPTTVVNVRRHQFDVYIGRAGHGYDGYFGNPYRPGESELAACLDRYCAYFLGRVESDPEFRRRVLALRGKRLACFCVREPWTPGAGGKHRCHGQIMAEWIDSQVSADAKE